MSARLQVAVVGPTGYTGFELLKILFRHPRVQDPLLFLRETSKNGSAKLSDVFPQISGNGTHSLEPFSWTRLHQAGVDLVFLATPHEFSREFVPQAIARGLRVIDLSGAWRLRQAQHRCVYGLSPEDASQASGLDDRATYGICELNRDAVAQAQLVANPGCYPTSIILALAPLIDAGWVDTGRGVICDSKSGVSGAGKEPTPQTHFVSVADNFRAYNPIAHRHRGEILEQLGIASEDLVFTPHLLPIPRGLFSTVYVRLHEAKQPREIEQLWRDFYVQAPFVRVFSPPQLPEIAYSLHSNFCDLGFALSPSGTRLTLFSCIDNLVKGAAGQAVQNMNVMYGFDEREGLQ